jgi:phage terminase large subunit-like protein
VPIVIETQGGQGQSVAQNLRRQYPKLRLVEVPRTIDKFSAAQPCAAAWNAGRFQVPLRHDPSVDSLPLQKLLRDLECWDEGDWIAGYLKEHSSFTGKDGAEDDQVDSTVHNWDFADKQPASKPKVPARGSRKAAATGGY